MVSFSKSMTGKLLHATMLVTLGILCCLRFLFSGRTLNIANAYSHPLFYRGIDEATGFRTRCFTPSVLVAVGSRDGRSRGLRCYRGELLEMFSHLLLLNFSKSMPRYAALTI